MLASIPEKKMRIVRGMLALGWIAILVSLFWDPFTIELTRPDNLASPFHLKNQVIRVQSAALPQALPYGMGPRIFWTMLIPLVPLFLMLFGHEAWRRICPLSFINQIPRYLSWQRKTASFNRKSGLTERQLNLFKKGGWMQRNAWIVQFGLLFVAINLRILFLNSAPIALGIFFIAVIASSLFAGYYWGGKTWCNYICPVSIVQKIYTQPGGLLESQAHMTRKPITQSMCRTTTPTGEQSICVGCIANCSDIDLENSHWEGIDNPARRFAYYGFFGLIAGFNAYFYLYSGNWDYYFSGIWTHEAGVMQKLFDPGFYFGGESFYIPKLFAAPLTIGLSVFLAFGLGVALEKAYARLRNSIGRPLSQKDLLNQCFAFSAFLSINTFYIFAGRSNLLLLPPAAMRLVDALIIIVSTLWFWRAIQRTPEIYRRESVSRLLLTQLKNLKFDFKKVLEGRALSDLNPDEVHILAKTLPGFSREQKASVYRNVLQDALATGKTNSGKSLELLREVRLEMGLSEDDHASILAELGIDNSDLLDAEHVVSQESWIRANNYRSFLERLITQCHDAGAMLPEFLARAATQHEIRNCQELFQISGQEHAEMLAQLTGAKSALVDKAVKLLDVIAELTSACYTLKLLRSKKAIGPSGLLARLLAQRRRNYCEKLLNILVALGPIAEAEAMAHDLFVLLGGDTIEFTANSATAIGKTCAHLDSEIRQMLIGEAMPRDTSATQIKIYSYSDVVAAAQEPKLLLAKLFCDHDQFIGSIALFALAEENFDEARMLAKEFLREDTDTARSLTRETAAAVASGGLGPKGGAMAAASATQVTLQIPGRPAIEFSFEKPVMTIGSAQDNDIVVPMDACAAYHAVLRYSGDAASLENLNHQFGTRVNGQIRHAGVHRLSSGDRLEFHMDSRTPPSILVHWDSGINRDYFVQPLDTVSKLQWLSDAEIFSHLEMGTLADMARSSEFRVYRQGALVCAQNEQAEDAFMLHSGAAEAFVTVDARETVVGHIGQGKMVGELGVIASKPRTASIRISSEQAGVLVIPGHILNALMDTDPRVAKAILITVVGYTQSNR